MWQNKIKYRHTLRDDLLILQMMVAELVMVIEELLTALWWDTVMNVRPNDMYKALFGDCRAILLQNLA